MNRLHYIIVALGITMLFAGSCSNPEKQFQKSLATATVDKFISLSEFENLTGLLGKTLSSKKQVNIGTFVIGSEEDLITYLSEIKKCTVESLPAKVPVGFKKFYVFLENSVSMRGYIGNGNPNFAEPILALFECGDETTEFTTAYAGAKSGNNPSVNFVEIPQSDFFANITGGKFITADASPLDKMLSEAVGKILPESGDVSESVFCFITDGIMSGSNAEIVADREFTKKNLPVLEKRIRDAIGTASKQDLHCVVYRLETFFNGDYYDYQNTKHYISGDRPYFMILVGHRENLSKIENRLAKESNFTRKSPNRFASYEVASLQTLTKGTLRAIPGQNGQVKHQTIIEYKAQQAINMPVVFAIQLNLNNLPGYYQDINELHSHLYLSYTDNLSGTKVRIPFTDWPMNVIENMGNNVYRLTISLEPEILQKMMASGEMTLTLPGHQDNWYRDYSCDDDTKINAGDKTTFALDRFMGGIMKGFGFSNTEAIPDAISFKFYVKKK